MRLVFFSSSRLFFPLFPSGAFYQHHYICCACCPGSTLPSPLCAALNSLERSPDALWLGGHRSTAPRCPFPPSPVPSRPLRRCPTARRCSPSSGQPSPDAGPWLPRVARGSFPRGEGRRWLRETLLPCPEPPGPAPCLHSCSCCRGGFWPCFPGLPCSARAPLLPCRSRDSRQRSSRSSRPLLSTGDPGGKTDGLFAGQMRARRSFHALDSSAKDGRVP